MLALDAHPARQAPELMVRCGSGHLALIEHQRGRNLADVLSIQLPLSPTVLSCARAHPLSLSLIAASRSIISLSQTSQTLSQLWQMTFA